MNLSFSRDALPQLTWSIGEISFELLCVWPCVYSELTLNRLRLFIQHFKRYRHLQKDKLYPSVRFISG